jgi:hypothetical protein
MPGQNNCEWPEERPLTEGELAFAAFTLSHTHCGDVIELRLDGGALLQWCVACADARVFGSADA